MSLPPDMATFALALSPVMTYFGAGGLSMTLSITTTVPLNSGVSMPIFGLGTFRMPTGAVEAAVHRALSLGYRLLDTASAYGNEAEVGRAVATSGLDRGSIFLTTKVWVDEQGYDETRAACRRSLTALGTPYVDLYLIHWPEPKRWPDAWRAMLALQESGLCRAIGVSNFAIHHLEALREISPAMPAVNQVEFNPFRFDRDLLAYCRDHNIRLEAYTPLTRGAKLHHPTIDAIATDHGKTAAQVLLRWGLQHGVIEIPKATGDAHLRENAAIFNFALTDADMAALDGLDEGYTVVNPEWRAKFA
jgi:diketogulonate reductase-like aldo/keto reductase